MSQNSLATQFTDKVVLITGAAGGIGREVARALLDAGAIICIGDINTDGCDETVRPFLEKDKSRKHLIYSLNVASSSSVKGFIDASVAAFGRIDYAFNNAGILCSPKLLADVDEDEYDRVVDIDMKGVFLCLKYQIPAMINTGGKGVIVNTASTHGTVGDKLAMAYIAAKHGVVGLTRAAAMDYVDQKIRVNAIAPGLTLTPMIASRLADPELRGPLLSKIPMQRLAAPEEIVGPVLYLLSDASSYVTGQVMVIDGGTTVM
ncbi:SDR family oxidoreductase [Kockiozyma suomiensis]|uniref:SDR family oxidoreductase n=1 Tax=Kockiozyma suomiensis TaxID=1337062 RepID=UPI0033441F97